MSSGSPTGGTGLLFAIESDLPPELAVGRGNLLPIYGWCFHGRQPIRRLELLVDGEAQPLLASGMPRPDVIHRLSETSTGPENAYRSGFWGLLKVAELESPRELEIGLRASLGGGGTATVSVGRIHLVPGDRRPWPEVNGGKPEVIYGGQPQVAICMATFNPPPQLFERQIESIRAQTYENWVCLISDDASNPEALALIERLVGDDPRFRFERHSERLGYYRNFERALAAVPAEAEMVALSDQDDHWHPDKLATLIERISGEVTLAYSDATVTDLEGETLSETFWTERANNSDDLGALLLVNSITGGASLFRSWLLRYILPFPHPVQTALHDHWVGMVAMSLGEVAYVDRPLYDYVQHGSAALGHESLRRPRRGRKGLAKLQAFKSRSAFRSIAAMRLAWARRGYPVVLGVEASATLLLMRAGKHISRRKRRTLRRYARLERSPATWGSLLVRAQIGRAKTLGSERFLVAGSLWRMTASAVKNLRLPPPAPAAVALSSWLKPPLSPDEPLSEPERTEVERA